MRSAILFCIICLTSWSCQQPTGPLTIAEKEEIAKSAKEVVQKVFEYSNNMDFETGLNHYSDDPNAYFITDGIMHSLADLKEAYQAVGPSVEELHNTIKSWQIQVLSSEVVTVTLPVMLKLKLKDVPEFNGELTWTATLQKQNEKWLIVQSHESWLNCAQVSAALTSIENN